jgi:hypothetical protein
MKMKHIKFDSHEIGQYDSYLALLSTEGVNILRNHVTDFADERSIYHVWYELTVDMVAKEKSDLHTWVEMAVQVNREEYDTFKNAAQRQIYLLKVYGYCSKDAGTVMELLKPEMAWILEGGKPNVKAGN